MQYYLKGDLLSHFIGERVGMWICNCYATHECPIFHYRIFPCQPALARCDVNIQLPSLLMNAWPSMSAFWRARSGPGV